MKHRKKIAVIGNANNLHMLRWVHYIEHIGYEPIIYSANPSSYNINCKLYVNKSKKRYDIIYYMQLSKILRNFKIINLHMPLFKGILLFLLPPRKITINILGSEIIDFPNRYPLLKFYLKKVLERAKLIIVPNQFLHNQVQQLSSKPLPITQIIYGVDTNKFNYIPKKPPFEPFTLILPKEFKPVYGTDILLKAFIKLQEKYSDIHLILTGKRKISDNLIKLINTSPKKENIHLIGWTENINKYLVQSHITILPSRSESFGVVALESMIVGTPVIASNIGGLKDIIKETNGGILFEKGNVQELIDSIEQIKSDYINWTKKMKNVSEFVCKKYSTNVQIKQMISKWLKY